MTPEELDRLKKDLVAIVKANARAERREKRIRKQKKEQAARTRAGTGGGS
jgi:hypothetical protein